jgi:Uncharacterised protein domain (DUF2415)
MLTVHATSHWQLRNYISSSEPDTLHYVAKQEVYSLNTKTHVRTRICKLPWTATRCFASGFGYILVGGGDNGHFAVIKLDESSSFAAEVDAHLDMDFRNRAPRRAKPQVKILQLGSEIVNSISIHMMENPEEPGVLDDIVAVLTNNDHSCRIYSLTQEQQTAVLEHPFAVNHATISPDGSLLVVVGDYQQAFFYERVNLRPSEMKACSSKYASNLCQWEDLAFVPLHPSRSNAFTGYFATAWSPSGHLCAVASEWGYITVFDVDQLKSADYNEDGEDAIVAVIPSSRPDTGPGPGSVRSMLFSPAPWDLLIWSEDQGRVCVADLRSSLRVRQVLRLDEDELGLKKIEFVKTESLLNPELDIDTARDPEFNQRNRRGYEHLGSNYISVVPELTGDDIRLERQREHLRRNRELQHHFDEPYQTANAQERLLEGLRTRTPLESTRSSTPRSIHYGPSELSGERRTASSASSNFTADFPALTRSTAATMADSLSAWRSGSRANDVVREYLRERNNDAERDRERDRDRFVYSPRRQASIVLDRDDDLPDNIIIRSSTTSRHPPLPPQLRPQTSSPSSFSPERGNGTLRPGRVSPPPPGTELNPEIIEIRRQRQLARQRERILGRERGLNRYEANINASRRNMANAGHTDPEYGPQTAGLAISEDGQTLWAAGECGIWEFQIDLFARRCFAAVEMR